MSNCDYVIRSGGTLKLENRFKTDLNNTHFFFLLTWNVSHLTLTSQVSVHQCYCCLKGKCPCSGQPSNSGKFNFKIKTMQEGIFTLGMWREPPSWNWGPSSAARLRFWQEERLGRHVGENWIGMMAFFWCRSGTKIQSDCGFERLVLSNGLILISWWKSNSLTSI